MVAPHDETEPETVNEALCSTTKEQYKRAMEEERESININQVWELINLPLCYKAIRNKQILKIKQKAVGIVEQDKACRVAKGYTQQKGIDYEETFFSNYQICLVSFNPSFGCKSRS